MGNVVPINKQGRFNLGPGTAPSTSTPNPQQKNRYVRPRDTEVCSACGTKKPIPGEKYCVSCVQAGLDTPIIECIYYEDCHTTTKRRHKGQHYFICPKHKETPNV